MLSLQASLSSCVLACIPSNGGDQESYKYIIRNGGGFYAEKFIGHYENIKQGAHLVPIVGQGRCS